jgi:predicted amidophosphoribosyltransferase
MKVDKCENCGVPVYFLEDLCSTCQEEADEVEQNTCWKCEIEIDDDSMYCESCNEEMEQEQAQIERQYRRDVL